MFDIITVFSVPLDHIYESSWWVFNPNHFEQAYYSRKSSKWMEHLPPSIFPETNKSARNRCSCQLLDLMFIGWGAHSSPCGTHLLVRICPDHDFITPFCSSRSAQNQSIQVTLREKLTVSNAGNPPFSNRTYIQNWWIFQPAMVGLPECISYLATFLIGWHGFGSLGNPWKTPRLTALRLAGAMLQGARRGKDLSPRKGWCVCYCYCMLRQFSTSK